MLKAKAAQVICKLLYWIGTGGSKPTPPDNNFQSPVWGSSSTSGGVKPPNPPDKSNPAWNAIDIDTDFLESRGSSRCRDEIAGVGRKDVGVYGVSESVSVLWNAGL